MFALKVSVLEVAMTHYNFISQIFAAFHPSHPADGMPQFVVDIALSPLASVILMPDSAKKPILRHAAIALERLAENRDIADQMHRIPGISDAIIVLVRAPRACVWRNALRAALLMSYHSPTAFGPCLLQADVFPQIVQLLVSDQLELRFDGIRGLRGLSQTPGGSELLMQQPAVLESLCRLCLSTTLPIEFEHTAATIALLLASAPEARAWFRLSPALHCKWSSGGRCVRPRRY